VGLSELEGIRARRPVWSEAAERGEQPTETPQPNGSVPDWIKIAFCVLFLAFSVVAWASLPKALYYILFFIPNYICGEYLGGTFFSESLGESISEKDFSFKRIFVGVLLTLFLLAIIYGLGALVFWL